MPRTLWDCAGKYTTPTYVYPIIFIILYTCFGFHLSKGIGMQGKG